MVEIVIAEAPFDGPVAKALGAAALDDLAERYGGEGDATPVDAAQFEPPTGRFLIAWAGDDPVGCGGWRTLSDDDLVVEVKRMYTVPAWRGRGVASAVLQAIEASAREAGKRRVILETGVLQPEAIRLYERSGYVRIPNFGHYKDSALSVSYGRDLA